MYFIDLKLANYTRHKSSVLTLALAKKIGGLWLDKGNSNCFVPLRSLIRHNRHYDGRAVEHIWGERTSRTHLWPWTSRLKGKERECHWIGDLVRSSDLAGSKTAAALTTGQSGHKRIKLVGRRCKQVFLFFFFCWFQGISQRKQLAKKIIIINNLMVFSKKKRKKNPVWK